MDVVVVVAVVGVVNLLVSNDKTTLCPTKLSPLFLRFTVLNQIIIEFRKMNSFSHLLCELSSLDP